MDHRDSDSSLFENPPGVRQVDPIQDMSTVDMRDLSTADMTAVDVEGFDRETQEALFGSDPEADIRNTRDRRRSLRRQLASEGSQFLFGLVLFTVSAGALALALTMLTSVAIFVSGATAVVTTGWFWTRWRKWLEGAPYCYRLLTSLGEDAENLLHWRFIHTLRQLRRKPNGTRVVSQSDSQEDDQHLE